MAQRYSGRGAGGEQQRQMQRAGKGRCEWTSAAKRALLIPLTQLRLIVQSKVAATLSALDKWVTAGRPAGVQSKSGRTSGALFIILSLPALSFS